MLTTTKRIHGRLIHTATTGADIVAACRNITESGGFAKINDLMVDLFSASAVIAVYDGLKPENQANYCGLADKQIAVGAPKVAVYKMAEIAFRLLNKPGVRAA